MYYELSKTIVTKVAIKLSEGDDPKTKIGAIKLLRELCMPVMRMPLRDAKNIVEAIMSDTTTDYIKFEF